MPTIKTDRLPIVIKTHIAKDQEIYEIETPVFAAMPDGAIRKTDATTTVTRVAEPGDIVISGDLQDMLDALLARLDRINESCKPIF